MNKEEKRMNSMLKSVVETRIGACAGGKINKQEM